MHTNTTTLSTTTLTEEALIRPLNTFSTSVVITKELLLLRATIAHSLARKSNTTIDGGYAWCVADCCRWDLEGYLQN